MTRNTRKHATSSANVETTQAKKKKTTDLKDEPKKVDKQGDKKTQKKQKKAR